MTDLILTGASRGIGRALALELAARPGDRLILVARDRGRLDALVAEVEQRGGRAVAVPADLSSLAAARALGERLAGLVAPPATLIHNAGVWPHRPTLTADGLETAFVVNHLAPLAMQQALLDAAALGRILVISAGLIAMGRFDAGRTSAGEDFSSWRTYCTTKLCLALAMRDVAERYPGLDVAVLHPGVVRTDLGARPGPVGWLLALAKRRWEAPEVCAARLARIVARPRWSPPGQARWLVEERERPWPKAADDPLVRAAVLRVTAGLLGRGC